MQDPIFTPAGEHYDRPAKIVTLGLTIRQANVPPRRTPFGKPVRTTIPGS